MSIELVMPENYLILSCPPLLLPWIFPSIRVFSNELALCIKWLRYWSFSFSFSISPSNEYSGLISFRIDWFETLAVQGNLKSLLQYHNSKASILWHSAFFMVQTFTSLHDYWKNHGFNYKDLWRQKKSLCFVNKLSRFVIAFLPRSKHLLISWLQLLSTVILEPKKIKCHYFHFSPFYLPWSDGTRCQDFSFLNVEFEASLFTLLSHFHQQAL